MYKTEPHFIKSAAAIPVAELRQLVEGWLLDGDIRQHSDRTQGNRREIAGKLLWFLDDQRLASCGLNELRKFFAYLTRGHEDPRGRWGNPLMRKPIRPRTVHTYHANLRTMYHWFVSEGAVSASPMDAIATPIARPDQVQPFTQKQVDALLTASRRTTHPRRDEVIVLFLFDTGVRASELCGLTMRDIDVPGKKCTVLGKGNITVYSYATGSPPH